MLLNDEVVEAAPTWMAVDVVDISILLVIRWIAEDSVDFDIDEVVARSCDGER